MSPSNIKPAFKYDFGPALLKQVDAVGIPNDRRFARIVIVSSVVVHFILLLVNPSLFFSPPEINLEDSTTVDLEFAGDLTLRAPQETALPNAKESPDVAVPANLLPQLPKKFEVEESKKAEEKPFVEEKDPKVDDSLAKQEVSPPEKIETLKTKDDPNKVTKEDLLKRLAVEKLKRENKIDQQMKAQKDALAKLKEDLLAQNAKTNSGIGSTGASDARARTYADLLRAAVKRNLYLPKTFEYDRAQLVTQLTVIINGRGELVEVKLAKSSGNGAYDQAAIAALQNSVPLPQPPSEIVGQSITFNLSK